MAKDAAAKPEEKKPLSAEQIQKLKEATVETICKMANLMRPQVRNQKLGVDLKRMENMMHAASFRADCIETLALQMFDLEVVAGEAWKTVLSTAWKERELKNRFVDTAQLTTRPNLCRIGCKRLTDEAKYDTCCQQCATRRDLFA